jgi:hypothetical protein
MTEWHVLELPMNLAEIGTLKRHVQNCYVNTKEQGFSDSLLQIRGPFKSNLLMPFCTNEHKFDTKLKHADRILYWR